MTEEHPRAEIALISMPWQDPYSPSIQLGSLSAWAKQERPDYAVTCHSLFLELAHDIGMHLAKRISISWIGEALFAYLLFPTQRASIASFLEASRKDDPLFRDLDYGEIIEKLRIGLERRLDAVDWQRCTMVDLSVVFAQTLSSLLVAREIKRRAPACPIVLGGPGVTGQIGVSILRNFDFVDYIVNGEGERPLLTLVDGLLAGGEGPVDGPGIVHRGTPPPHAERVHQLTELADLPAPDYDEYFERLDGFPDGQVARGRVRVPIETNRGCWWDRSLKDPMQSCSFCNLNLQWKGYRQRPEAQSVALFAELNDRYHCPDFTVVDNILRHHGADDVLAGLEGLDLGLDLWMEARASVKPEQVVQLRKVGARVIQFGIEALSTSMLRKMAKGTTTIQNLQAMKLCEQHGIQNSANLIIEYPGMDEGDILEELRNIRFARSFYHLSTTEFSLVYQSPAYKAPERFDIANIRSYEMYRLLMPAGLYDRLLLTEQSFDSEALDRLRPLWHQVRLAANDWKAHYEAMRHRVEGNLLLSFQDGGTYLKFRDFREAEARFHWISEVERDVYLACEHMGLVRDLYAKFPTVPPEQIDRWLEDWHRRRLAFVETGKVLALAIPWGPVSSRRALTPAADAALSAIAAE